MAQINVTLDQDEILRLLADSSGDAFRQVLAAALNAVMRAESDEQLGAGRYERSESRTDSRNGTRARRLTTRVGASPSTSLRPERSRPMATSSARALTLWPPRTFR